MSHTLRVAFATLGVGAALLSGTLAYALPGSSGQRQSSQRDVVLPPNVEILNPGPTIPIPTVRGGLHACPDGFAVSGIHADNDVLLCMRMLRPGYQLSSAAALSVGITSTNQFTRTTRPALGYTGPNLHWCGPNRFMVGIDLKNNTNTLLCSAWAASPPVAGGAPPLLLVVDQPPSATQRNGLHACPQGWAVMGAHIGRNIFVCGKVVQ